MKRSIRWSLSVLMMVATVAIAGPGAHGPNGEHLDTAAGPSGSGLVRLPDGSVNVPKLSQRRMGLRTVIAPLGKAAGSVELSGRVVMDPNAGGRVQASHGGTVEPGPQGLPVAGQAVRKGQVLAFLRHHAEPFAQANQQSQLAELRTAREVAEQRLRRLESLEGTTPRKEIEAARSELAGLQTRERSIGGSLSSREPVTAPVSGVIARADVLVGQVVDARELMFEVVDPARLLVEAVVADPTLAALLSGAELKLLPGYRLTPVGAARALRDGVLPITFRATAAKDAAPLAIGQPVTVVARLKTETEGIVLPASAVVRNPANEPVVWIKATAERFVPQPVQLQTLDAATVLVTKGLAADNRVVVQGAALVNQIR
ncbi:efflux RND transporter periplasmic adaptor subunit [Rhizobacter sp. J219]|uniref:efflux RND transporter periplasmic adaptor subunit n=1 Tax=Rhizobacter sp. J219 TaxID=2898430 RepID=UPI002151D3A2|nr:efflux RND transporter periplasmic adaptor subunit [Rhizobacter sp. J219]MCR5882976.1 efflux RND transporter periplasmic adaptor subunit [Rhizobacter sp. J219]